MDSDKNLTDVAPTALVIPLVEARESHVQNALANKGWQIRTTSPHKADIGACFTKPISLVILESDEREQAEAFASSIRARPEADAAVPLLGLFHTRSAQPDPNSSKLDAVLYGDDPVALAQAASSWWPVSLTPTRRIATMLGAGPIAGMIERLGLRLEAALTKLPAASVLADGVIDKGEAHRLAGLCGTLGFAQAHAAWLDLSLGDESALDEVRRTTRLTLAAIARGL